MSVAPQQPVVWLDVAVRVPDVQWFPQGLVFKARRLLYHSTLGFRVINKKRSVLLIPDPPSI